MERSCLTTLRRWLCQQLFRADSLHIYGYFNFQQDHYGIDSLRYYTDDQAGKATLEVFPHLGPAGHDRRANAL